MMNQHQLRQRLQEIAEEAVADDLDLWPALERKLHKQSRPGGWAAGKSMVLRLAGVGATLAAVAFFVLWLASLPSIVTPPAASEMTQATPMTAPATAPTAMPWPERYEVTTAAGLHYPAAPSTLPRYQVDIILPPDTAEAIVAWANQFGLPDAKLFRDPRNPEALIVLGSTGERLSFYSPTPQANFNSAIEHFLGVFTHSPSTHSPPLDFHYPPGYLRADWLELAEGETISFVDGAAAAVSFLERHNQLPEPYHVRDLPSPMFNATGYALRMIHVSPDLGGYSLVGLGGTGGHNGIGTTLLVDAAGMVISAEFRQAAFTSAEPVALRPAQEVVTDFISDRLDPIAFQAVPTLGSWHGVAQYAPPLPMHTIGEQVTVLETDDAHFLIAEDGSEIRATLRTGLDAKYELLTPELGQMAATTQNDELQVTGTIVGQTAADTWQLEVETWELLRQQVLVSGCAVGPVEIDVDGTAWITAEKTLGQVVQNERYRIPNLPQGIGEGDQIEVCSESTLELGEELKWTTIYAPPRALAEYGLAQPNNQTEGTELVIERVELAYYVEREDEGRPAEPVWVVEGYSQDRAMRFVAMLPATAAPAVPIE
jgi:hypothetical protein